MKWIISNHGTLPTLDIQVSWAGNLSRRIGSSDFDGSDVFRSNIEQSQYVRLLVDVVSNDTSITLC